MKTKTIYVVLFVLASIIIIFVVKDLSVSVTKNNDPVISSLALSYKKLNRMTEQPVLINAELSALCSGVSREDIERMKLLDGPHTYTQVDIYMNDLASNAFKIKPYSFPVGSVIIKDKDFHVRIAPAGVGGMVKRAAGYDSAHGDWEYFYFVSPYAIEHGRIESCVGCHAKTASTDYVFGNWSEGKKSNLKLPFSFAY